MNAPLLWGGLPLLTGIILWFFRGYHRRLIIAGIFFCGLFGLLAYWLPFENLLQIGGSGFRIESTLNILGRQFVLTESERPILVLLYGFGTIWFAGLLAAPQAGRMVPYGLAILGLLVTSIAVQPFLYAALIIEVAVLLCIPMLVSTGGKSGNGILRFFIFLTLAVPFMLLAGWAAEIAEANPANPGFISRAAIFLALGFSFWLAVFPFFTWVPMLVEESNSYVSGFIISVLSVVVLFLGVHFLNSYGWLTTLFLLPPVLRLVGGLMILTGGVWAGFDRNIKRLPAHITIMQNGLAIVAIGLTGQEPLLIFSGLFIPRLIMMAFLCLAISILDHNKKLEAGAFYSHPATALIVLVSIFSFAGLPLLAGFPSLLILIERLAQQSVSTVGMAAIGILGLLAAGIRHFISMMKRPSVEDEARETLSVKIIFFSGCAICILIGLFPGKIIPIAASLVQSFQNWQ